MKPEVNGSLLAFGLLLLFGTPLEDALGASAVTVGALGFLRSIHLL